MFGGVSVEFSHRGFSAEIYGGVRISIEIGFFRVNFNLASLSAGLSVTLTGAEGRLSIKVGPVQHDWFGCMVWGPPPVLATKVGSTLYLNTGSRVGSRGSLYKDMVDDSYGIKQDGDRLEVVSGLGHEQSFSGVSSIVADLGDGEDFLFSDESVTKNAEITAGGGNDTIIYSGSGRAVIHGQSGNNTIYLGPAGGTVFGGIGDDGIFGGEGNATIHGGRGNNFIDRSW